MNRTRRYQGHRKTVCHLSEKLYRSVVGQMSEHGLDKSTSKDYTASLIRQQKLTVKPAAFAKLVTKNELLESVSVSGYKSNQTG